jgi:hypothetical protein
MPSGPAGTDTTPEREECRCASYSRGGVSRCWRREPVSTAVMNADDPAAAGGNAQLPATVAPPRSRQPVPVRAADQGGPVSHGGSRAGARHRLWWHWLLIGLLVAASAGVTALFAETLANALLQRHWAQAVDSTREAVPAAVGWSALFMIFFIGGTRATRGPPADRDDIAATEVRDTATQLRAVAEDDAVRQAEECVQSLTARLRLLAAGEHAESACTGPDRSVSPDSPDSLSPESPQPESPHSDRSLARQVAETSARLERARQWLISAQAALAATRESAASLATQPGRGDRSDT